MSAQFRLWFYRISAVAAALVPILVATRVVTESQGNQWLALVAAIGGLFGVAGAGTAAVVLGKQTQDGTLDSPAPADAAITAIQQTIQNATTASAELDRVKQVATDALGQVPVLGPLSKQVIDAAGRMGL